MSGTFSNSFQLVKESFSILRKDKEIVWFPIISSIFTILFAAIFIFSTIDIKTGELEEDYLYFLKLFVFYLLLSFVMLFFNAGLISCANIRLKGGDPTFNDGFKSAVKNIGKIFLWALICATIGVILSIISGKSKNRNFGRRAASGILGTVWGFLTFFVLPVMIFEGKGIFQAVEKSVFLFKKTWGENIIAQFSMGFFFGILSLVGFIPIIVLFYVFYTDVALFIAIILIYTLIFGVITSALNGIFVTALYRYAITGEISSGFSPELIKKAFKPNQLSNKSII